MAGLPRFPVPAVLKVDSDWGNIVLITDHALIEKEPHFVYPPDVRFTGTQLFVGEQQSLRTDKKTIPFIILGSGDRPVDIITAHGDASSGPEPGNVTVEILPGSGLTLYNDLNNGDGVNAKVFPRVPLPINQ